MNKKKIYACMSKLAIVTMITTSLATSVFAADGDFWVNGKNTGSVNQFILDNSRFMDLVQNIDKYTYEVGGNLYSAKEVNSIYEKNEGVDQKKVFEKIKNDLPSQGVAEEKIVVNSVQATSTTVDTKGTLQFAINGSKENVDLAKVKAAGYKVEFVTSDAKLVSDVEGDNNFVSINTTGKVKTNVGDVFEYEIRVSKDGKEVAKSQRIKVTAQVDANTVTSISSVELYVKQNEVYVKVGSGKLAEGDIAKVVVTGRTANMKEDGDITQKVKLSTDKVAIATVNAEGVIGENGAKGDVTITASFGDITKKITINGGNAARAISKENTKINSSVLTLVTGASEKIEVEAKDQYGDAFVLIANGLTTSEVKNDKGEVIANAVTTGSVIGDKDGKSSVTVTAGNNAGTGDIIVKAGDVELGKVALTVKKAGAVDKYKLETANKKYDLDLMQESTKTFKLALNGYDKEGLLAETVANLSEYTFESSDDKVATVSNDDKGKVTAVANGTTVIRVFKTTDGFKTTVAEVAVTVKNSTPTITDATVVVPEKINKEQEIDLNKIFTNIKAINSKNEQVKTNSITGEDITVGNGNVKIGKFIVTNIGSNKIGKIQEGKISVSGVGKGIVNIALLNANKEIVKDVNVEIDIAQ